MKSGLFKKGCIAAWSVCILCVSFLYSQAPYPYSSGQSVFVQSPFNSSLYTTYQYNPYNTAPRRLPAYTTNQAVFIQQPYATAQQTVTSFPTTYANARPLTDNRYTPPTAFPSTVAPTYPFANTDASLSSPYTTINQSPTYRYPYKGTEYTSTYTYPYTTSTQTKQYLTPTVERAPASYGYQAPSYAQGLPSATYNAYPITTVEQYPYPTTSTAAPEMIVEPTKAKGR